MAILDNFYWGMWMTRKILALARCVRCKDFAIKYKLPFISGKDSLNNFSLTGTQEKISFGTLLISTVGINS